MGDGAEIQATLKAMTGQGTVPSVWIAGKHIGGNSDFQAMSIEDIKAAMA